MSSFLLLLNLVLVLAVSGLLVACLRIQSRSAHLLGLYILCYANVVLVLELAALPAAIRPGVVLAVQLAVTAIATLVWLRRGRPTLLGPFSGFPVRTLFSKAALRTALAHPLLLVLAISVTLVYIRQVQMILVWPPDDIDSLLYHLSRVAYWLQYQSVYPFPTLNLRQTTFPMNAELGVLWTILWSGTDVLAPFVQWLTVPVITTGIYGLARLLGYARQPAAFAALLWPTLTQVLYQSTTTQNDLVAASFWVAALYFFFAGLRQKSPPLLYLSGAAVGLAIGTKGTSFFVLPALALIVIMVFFFQYKDRVQRSLLLVWCLACTGGTFLFGSYMYVQNLVAFGHPLGPREIYAGHMGMGDSGGSVAPRSHLLRDNLGRYVFQLADLSSLPSGVAAALKPVKKAIFAPVFSVLGVDLENPMTIGRSSINLDYLNRRSENASWFGPLVIFLMPVLLYQLYAGARSKDALRIALAFIPIAFLLIHSATQRWTDSKGRYYLVPIALAFPLFAALVGSSRLRHRLLRSFLVLLGLLSMFTMLLHIMAARQIHWDLILLGERNKPSWVDEFNYRMIEEHVPLTASIGVDKRGKFRDYPFFGEDFTRQVTLSVPRDVTRLPRRNLQPFIDAFEGSDFLYLVGTPTPSTAELTSRQFSLLSTNGVESLWVRNDLRSTAACEQDRWPFKKIYRSESEVVCPRLPVLVGIKLEKMYGDFAPGVGPGVGRAFGFDLLVKDEALAVISVDVQPTDEQSTRTLNLSLTDADGRSQTLSRSFQGTQMLEFGVPVHPGLYHLKLFMADDSTYTRILKIQVRTE